MILRRLINHMKAQHWTAVVLDFIIVVLGVFIGLQVQDWNANNANRRIAEKYLTDIALDVHADVKELKFTRDSALDRISAADYLLRQLGNRDLTSKFSITRSSSNNDAIWLSNMDIPDPGKPAPEKHDQLWSLITGVYYYDVTRSAYDALISSGKVDLISDPKIMRALRDYYYLVNGLSETQNRTFQPARQMTIEAGIKHGLSPDGRISEADLVAAIRKDPSLAAVVAMARENAALHILLCNSVERKANELLLLLDEKKQ